MSLYETTNSSQPVNIICLKWGLLYHSRYVNNLFFNVKKNISLPFRFICFTDDSIGITSEVEILPIPRVLPLPKSHINSPWLKLEFLRDGVGNLRGETLFLDIDILITGSLDDFFKYHPRKFCIIKNWVLKSHPFKKNHSIGNSSVFRFNAGTTDHFFQKCRNEIDWAINNFSPEQNYLSYLIGEKYFWPEQWVSSFKRHSVPPFPINLFKAPRKLNKSKIVAFHGVPNPPEALRGFTPEKFIKFHRRTLPAKWINEYWELHS